MSDARIQNVIDRCRDRKEQERGDIVGMMVHRVGVDRQTGVELGFDGPAISDAFTGRNPDWAEVAAATGGQNAYTLFIGGAFGPPEFDGVIWQALELDEIGWHGRRFSRGYLGIGLIGDFRRGFGEPPSVMQTGSLLWILSSLCCALSIEPTAIVGHGEVAGAHGGNKAPGLPGACPGDLISMDVIRKQVAASVAVACSDYAHARLRQCGLSF
jgi:hypothetical protein